MRICDITEAPIEDFNLIGDFNKSSSFRKEPDRRLLTNPRYVERIKNMFSNTGLDFRMWFINNAEANRHTEVGQISTEWLEDNMPRTLAAIDNNQTIATDHSFGRNAINILYTNNKGVGWRPMTGWIIAHRMAHVILKPNFRQWQRNDPIDQIDRDVNDKFRYILSLYGIRPGPPQNSYVKNITNQLFDDPMFKRLLSAIGTMRSAREGKLRNWYEFMYECFAQYLINGVVKFNPAPPSLIQSYAYGRPSMSGRLGGPEQSEANYALQYIEDVMTQAFEQALHAAVGKIFLM